MKLSGLLAPEYGFIEIRQDSLRVLQGEQGLEIPLERLETGRLTDASRERVKSALSNFVKKPGSWSRQPALCAIAARGVSLRRLTLPAAGKEEFQRLLLLQIESEFPLPPEQLAWGYLPAGGSGGPERTAAGQEFVVAALKRESIEEYAELFSACGIDPIFTLAGIARSGLSPQPPGPYALLDIGRHHSELISFEGQTPIAIRILAWGGEEITGALEKALSISRDEAEKIKLQWSAGDLTDNGSREKIDRAIDRAVDSLARLMERSWVGSALYLSGKSAQLPQIAPKLAKALGGGLDCRPIEQARGEGRSAATLGLKRFLEMNGGTPPLILDIKNKKNGEVIVRPVYRKWLTLALALALGALALRYAEAILWKPSLSRKVARIKGYREGLPKIDRQLAFLRHVETNQPPYLDTLLVLANAAAPGTRVETLSLNRRGELSIRATMQLPQAAEFRSKLIDSGFFSTVVIEEQTPTPDRQRVVVRLSAQAKPPGLRPAVPVPPALPGEKRGPEFPGAPTARPAVTKAGRPEPAKQSP